MARAMETARAKATDSAETQRLARMQGQAAAVREGRRQ